MGRLAKVRHTTGVEVELPIPNDLLIILIHQLDEVSATKLALHWNEYLRLRKDD